MIKYLKKLLFDSEPDHEPKEEFYDDVALISKPEKEEYAIVKGNDLKNDDVIIHEGSRFKIRKCGMGVGAGSFDFGEYFWVQGYFMSHWGKARKKNFWLYENSPIIKCIF